MSVHIEFKLVDDTTLALRLIALFKKHKLDVSDLLEIPKSKGRKSAKQKWYLMMKDLNKSDLVTLIHFLHQKEHLPTIFSTLFGEENEYPDTYLFLMNYVGNVNVSKLIGLDPSALSQQIRRLDNDRNRIIAYIQKNWINHLLTALERKELLTNIQNQKLLEQRVNKFKLSTNIVKRLTYEMTSSKQFTRNEFEKARKFFTQDIKYRGTSDLVHQFVSHTYDVEDAEAKGIAKKIRNRLSTKCNSLQLTDCETSSKEIIQSEPALALWMLGVINNIKSYRRLCSELHLECAISLNYSSPNKESVNDLACIIDSVLSEAQKNEEKWFIDIVKSFGTKSELHITLSSYFQHSKLNHDPINAKAEVREAILYKFSEKDSRILDQGSIVLMERYGMNKNALAEKFGLTGSELNKVMPLIHSDTYLTIEEIIEMVRSDNELRALTESNETIIVDCQQLAFECGVSPVTIKNRIRDVRERHGGRSLEQIPKSYELISRPRSQSIKKKRNKCNSDRMGTFYVARLNGRIKGDSIELIKIGWTEFDARERLDCICSQSENRVYKLSVTEVFYLVTDEIVSASYDLEQEFKTILTSPQKGIVRRPLLSTNAHGKEEIFLMEDVLKYHPELLQEDYANKKHMQLAIRKYPKAS